MMPSDFDSALREFLDRRETPLQDSANYGLDGLERVRDFLPTRHVAEALPFLGMTLAEFQRKGAALEVRVSWLDVTLWMVPTDRDATALMAEGIRRGRVWTAGELMQFMAIADRSPGTAKTLAHTKLAMDGEIIEVRP